MSDHPFGAPSGAVDPFNPEAPQKVCCPRCKSENYNSRRSQYGLFRKCLDCRNEWSGGGVGAVQPEMVGQASIVDTVNAPDDCIPDNGPYMGAGFRISGFGED